MEMHLLHNLIMGTPHGTFSTRGTTIQWETKKELHISVNNRNFGQRLDDALEYFNTQIAEWNTGDSGD